jgi:hypothetical protein
MQISRMLSQRSACADLFTRTLQLSKCCERKENEVIKPMTFYGGAGSLRENLHSQR